MALYETRIRISYQVRLEKCTVCRSVPSHSPSFRYTTLDFYVSESQLLPEYSLSSISCWASPHHQHVEISSYFPKCIGFQTCIYDTQEGAKNNTTIFYILLSTRREFWLLSQDWPLGLLSLSRQSVPSP